MIKNLIYKNQATIIYACDVVQFRRLLNAENLSINELNTLKSILNIHNKKADAFSYIVEQELDNKIENINLKQAI